MSGTRKKEQEVILLVAEGLNNKEISAKLHLSEGTVRNYLSHILIKLNLRDQHNLQFGIIRINKRHLVNYSKMGSAVILRKANCSTMLVK